MLTGHLQQVEASHFGEFLLDMANDGMDIHTFKTCPRVATMARHLVQLQRLYQHVLLSKDDISIYAWIYKAWRQGL